MKIFTERSFLVEVVADDGAARITQCFVKTNKLLTSKNVSGACESPRRSAAVGAKVDSAVLPGIGRAAGHVTQTTAVASGPAVSQQLSKPPRCPLVAEPRPAPAPAARTLEQLGPDEPAAGGGTVSTSYPRTPPPDCADCVRAPAGPMLFQRWPPPAVLAGAHRSHTVSIFHESWTGSAHRGGG